MFLAAAGPWLRALAQCSTRTLLTETGVPGGGHVAGGEDPRDAGLEVLVDLDAVADPDPAASASSVRGTTPMPTTTRSASMIASVGGAHALGGSLPTTRFDAGAQVQVDAVAGVELAEHVAHLGAHHLGQGHGAGLDHGHLGAHLPGRGGHLGADPAGADHDDPAGLADGRREAVGVADVAQVVDAGQVGAGHRQSPRRRAGGEQEPVVGQPLAVSSTTSDAAGSSAFTRVEVRSSMPCSA